MDKKTYVALLAARTFIRPFAFEAQFYNPGTVWAAAQAFRLVDEEIKRVEKDGDIDISDSGGGENG